MSEKKKKHTFKIKGKQFKEIAEDNMQAIQASGATESGSISKHTLAKILMKGGGISDQWEVE